jgi:multidrug efflux pump subunit AcrB
MSRFFGRDIPDCFRGREMRSFVQAVIRFRFLVLAVAAGIMIAGVVTLPRMSSDVLPESSPVTVDIQTEALGLSAPEVEELVTVPLEKNLFEGILGVTDETSDSIPGLSDIELHFAPGTNLYQARQLVQERLNSAFVLPNVSSPPTMIQPVSTTSDVMLVGLTSKTTNLINMSVLTRWTIVPKLLGLDGVANVSTYGQSNRQLQVLVDPAKMAAQGVALSDVISAVGNSQLVSPVSYLQGSTPGTGGYLEDGNQRLDIRHILPFGTPSDLAGTPIKPGVAVGDVARVVIGHQPLIGNALVDGTPGLMLVIQKLPGASVTAVTNQVRQALASLHLSQDGVTATTTLFQQGTYVTSASSDLRTAVIAAGVLAFLALLLLLLSLRAAFVAVVSVGVSLTVALLVLYLFGNSYNALLLLGLLLALGVVIADASSGGLAPGMGAALLVVLLSGLPLLVSAGTTASFLRPMAEAFMVAAAASTVVAATVATALTALLERAGPKTAPRQVAAIRGRLADGYRHSLRGAGREAAAMVIAAACVVAGIAVLAGIPFLHPGQPTFQDRNLVVRWTAAPGTSLTEMDRVAALATTELKAIPGVQDVGATLGRAITSDQIVATNSGELWVTMKPGANYAATLTAIKGVADGTPGIAGTVSTYESDAMGGVLTAPPDQVTTRVYGPDYATLEKLAGQVRSLMSGVPGVSGAQVQSQTTQPTADVTVNLDAADRDGVAPGDVRREAATLVQGLIVGNFFEDQAVFDVTVQAQPSDLASVQDIDNLLLDTSNGQHARLDQLATVSLAEEPADIQHENTSLYLDVTANASGRSASAVAADVSSRLASLPLPLEYSTAVRSGAALDAGTQSGAEPGDTVVPGTSFPAFMAYVLAALLGIFLIAHAALGRWRLALVAFASLPAALGGAVLVVYAAHWTGSLGAVAGLLGVFALAARQSVTVIARIRQGYADIPAAAASTAGHTAAVAVVTGAVMAPFAVSGSTAGLELLWPAACVILGGLVTVTLVSLYVLPVACLRLGPDVLGPGPVESAADEALVPPQREAAEPVKGRAAVGAAVMGLAVAAALSGCAASSSTASQPPTSKLVQVPGSPVPNVVLTPQGAQRIGLETVPVTAGQSGEATFPYSALLYEPNGQAAVYVVSGQLTFTRHFVDVDSITGNTVFVRSGVTSGERVVTDGAEELLGVQNGVGEET